MNEEPKKTVFNWEFGRETVSLEVGSYAYGERLYIGMISYGEDGPEPFADMTVNIPAYSLEPNEAFINGDISKDLLNFIRANRLGKILPYTVQSGFGRYSAVAINLSRLKEYDPKGVEEFMKQHGLQEKSAETTQLQKKTAKERER